jgi:hypothetical protein
MPWLAFKRHEAGRFAVGRTRMADQWICLFLARSGMKARAVFATEEQAKQFAEQHA